MSALILVVVGSMKFHKVGRGAQVLLDVDYREERQLGRRDCGHQNMVIELVEFDVVSNQIDYSKEVTVLGELCD